MRLTCLKCGHQTELALGTGVAGRINCVCGQDYTFPNVFDTGVSPNPQAAERSRARAFRAAGLVQNIGAFALGLSLLGILFFPLALVGAAVGVYVLTMLRGPVRRYSGYRAAIAAVPLGILVFVSEGLVLMSWLDAQERLKIESMQSGAAEDLRALLRAERLYRASTDSYGTFKELPRFTPTYGHYTFYLAPDDMMPGMRDSQQRIDPLPPDQQPGVSENSFTAIAVSNLDSDDDLDVWVLDSQGRIRQVANDIQK